MILQLTTGRAKRIGDRRIDVLVGVRVTGVVSHRHHPIRNDELEPNVKRLAMPLALVRALDDGDTALEPIADLGETIERIADRGRDGVTRGHIAEREFERNAHVG